MSLPSIPAFQHERRKAKKTTCEFFRVNYGSDNARKFDKLLSEVLAAKPRPQDRDFLGSDGDLYRLYNCEVEKGRCVGSLIRFRHGIAPQKASLNGDRIEDIHLATGEFLVEYYSFAYFPEFDIVVIQRNRNAGSPNRLAAYLRHFGAPKNLQFEPVLNNNAFEKLYQAPLVRSTELRFAVPTSNTLFETENKSLKEVIELGRMHGAAYVTIILSKGRKSGSLSISGTRKLFSDAIETLGVKTKRNPQGVTDAKAHTKSGDFFGADNEFLDMIEDRMQEEVEVRYNTVNPTTEDYYQVIIAAYDRRRDEIVQQFQTKKDKQVDDSTA